MNLLAGLTRLIQNASADKDNRERGADSLRQREVEALERIASRVSSTNRQGDDGATAVTSQERQSHE